MFLDSLVGDAAWMGRYARDRKGAPIPWDKASAVIASKHESDCFQLRSMIAVPFFEKALYELADADVTPARLLALSDEVEARIQGGPGSRPLLTVPHILDDEASCYYHGYVLAEMAVRQTRHYFLGKYGKIVDNPSVGRELAETVWKPGNSEKYLDLVEALTGKPLTGDAWRADLDRGEADLLEKEKSDYTFASTLPSPLFDAGPTKLDMRIRVVDGDAVIADSGNGSSFIEVSRAMEKYIVDRFLQGTEE